MSDKAINTAVNVLKRMSTAFETWIRVKYKLEMKYLDKIQMKRKSLSCFNSHSHNFLIICCKNIYRV